MQGTVCLHQNLHRDSPTPSNASTDMGEPTSSMLDSKEEKKTQMNCSDSGIFSPNSSSIHERSQNLSHNTRSDDLSKSSNTLQQWNFAGKFCCPICSKNFPSQHDFIIHIEHHDKVTETPLNNREYACTVCSKVFNSRLNWKRHLEIHRDEDPFTCEYCGETYNTRNDWLKHEETHFQKNEMNTTSDSSDSTMEYNNNEIHTKSEGIRQTLRNIIHKNKESLESKNIFKCHVCERADFDSIKVLQTHIEDNHFDSSSKCHYCDNVYPNSKQLDIHCSNVHENFRTRHTVVGFKDLTFVDFSSEKFPHIARFECEKNLHKVSGALKFQCKICRRAFPCSNSLEYHEGDCISLENKGLDLTVTQKLTDVEIRRNEFFSRLNLQGISPKKHSSKIGNTIVNQNYGLTPGNADFADIQSIISITNNPLEQLQKKSDDIAINPQKQINSGVQIDNSKNDVDDVQDEFAIEFRKMKQRGEFPCRLCSAIFPNLRALKGHNRAHLSGSSNGSYRCNMCPHSSVDKAALIRHMRTHNGDRPYECSLCNYAFTTKANCERHLRNRHSKTSREDIKNAIIYHPSEDPTNDEVNKFNREETKNSMSSQASIEDNFEEIHCSTPKKEIDSHFGMNSSNSHEPVSFLQSLQNTRDRFNISPNRESEDVFTKMNNEKIIEIAKGNNCRNYGNLESNITVSPLFPIPLNQNKVRDMNTYCSRINSMNEVKELKTSNTSNNDELYSTGDEDIVLDLSKKKKSDDVEVDKRTEDSPRNSSNKYFPHPTEVPPPLSSSLFHGNTWKLPTEMDQAAFYAQWAIMRNGLPALANWPMGSVFLQQLQNEVARRAQHIQHKMKEQDQHAGALMFDKRFQTIKQLNKNVSPQQLPFVPCKEEKTDGYDKESEIMDDEDSLNTRCTTKPKSPDREENESHLSKFFSNISHSENEIIQSSNSIKMVIKNGILIPKQKQRRYRTERPFVCEHCSARFTLRSNMERHIKQQHPQFWSQRQRGVAGFCKKTLNMSKTNFSNSAISNFDSQNSPRRINDENKTDYYNFDFRDESRSFLYSTKADEENPLVIDEKRREESSETDEGYPKKQEKSESIPIQLNEKMRNIPEKKIKIEENQDLVPISRLLDNASQQQFDRYFKRDSEEIESCNDLGVGSEEDEEGLIANESTSEGNISGTDENRSETTPAKKKSAYSLAPNRVSCPYCSRKFPWTSSLRRHILTHTGQKPFKCSFCPLLFTTKSNCDRHLSRKHGNSTSSSNITCSSNDINYTTRNAPERPFKCSNCPSSTFSTYSNLKKHMSCKHSTNTQGEDIKAQGYEAGSSEDEKMLSSVKDKDYWEKSSEAQPNVNADQPFKCHLCEFSFGDRREAIDHLEQKHGSEYKILMSKNAYDENATIPEENIHNDEDDNEIKNKFPDYSNRKVICAFCMRRFWSAEDLRRHMRTHTGERPFSCDICHRRFTLKHSMLRHRKKHNLNNSDTDIFLYSDEDANGVSAESGMNYVENKQTEKTDESDGNECCDLISNLLGIRPSFIDKVLTASPDDAAKLLGVKNGSGE